MNGDLKIIIDYIKERMDKLEIKFDLHNEKGNEFWRMASGNKRVIALLTGLVLSLVVYVALRK